MDKLSICNHSTCVTAPWQAVTHCSLPLNSCQEPSAAGGTFGDVLSVAALKGVQGMRVPIKVPPLWGSRWDHCCYQAAFTATEPCSRAQRPLCCKRSPTRLTGSGSAEKHPGGSFSWWKCENSADFEPPCAYGFLLNG